MDRVSKVTKPRGVPKSSFFLTFSSIFHFCGGQITFRNMIWSIIRSGVGAMTGPPTDLSRPRVIRLQWAVHIVAHSPHDTYTTPYYVPDYVPSCGLVDEC